MDAQVWPEGARRAIDEIRSAEIVVGIPSYNNARTIGHVVQAVHGGLAKYFPQFRAVIVNSDGGSRDGTAEAAMSSSLGDTRLLLLSTPMPPVHRLSFPYHGIPGKGSAFRLVFRLARELGAKVCAVVDSDLRSITPEWIDLLVRPVLHGQYDFVAPYYHRHKYDGTITNSIVYPLTRALYGKRVRQPIGGEFGISARLVSRYLQRTDWETDVARYGIDIWMTTIAIAEGFRVCQSFLGAKLHDAKDPGSDLSSMLHQVVGSVFTLMEEYEHIWRSTARTDAVDLFGFRFDVGLDPIQVNVERMLAAFRKGCRELGELWSMALSQESYDALQRLGCGAAGSGRFELPDDLWVRVVQEFACAHRSLPLERGHLLRSFTPLYLARVASFVIATQTMVSAEVEERIEQLCVCFEEMKPELVRRWAGKAAARPAGSPRKEAIEPGHPAFGGTR